MSCTWDSERGFGERSWRYACVINDMKVEKMFIEGGGVTQDFGPDPYEVSDADTMLEHLHGRAPADILLFTRPGCSHCRALATTTGTGLSPYAAVSTSTVTSVG